jgi:hypothetical protein
MNPYDSIASYRAFCLESGRKPKTVWGAFDESGKLQFWSVAKSDGEKYLRKRGGWKLEIVP